MLAYCARLLIKGGITAFLSLIMLHTVVSYIPGGPRDLRLGLHGGRGQSQPLYLILMLEHLELERPWPFSSLAWLFDPTENERLSSATEVGRFSITEKYVSPGININIAGIPIQGSGVLTGDLGESFMYKRGTPVMDIIGRGTDEYLLAHLAVLFVAMIIACVQRRGRPRLHELPARLLPSISATRRGVQAKPMYNWHGEGPLSTFVTKS